MTQLVKWALKNTTERDVIVMEASGNSFQIARTLIKKARLAKVLESCQMGKLKEAHANNDKISAVRIGKAFLAGTAKEAWIPDEKTQERRDWFHAQRKAVKIKINKFIGRVGAEGLQALGKERKAYRQEIHQALKAGRVYTLDPNKTFDPKTAGGPETVAGTATTTVACGQNQP